MTCGLYVLCAHVLGNGSLHGSKYAPGISTGWAVGADEIVAAYDAVGVPLSRVHR